jgi:hypothetical protein
MKLKSTVHLSGSLILAAAIALLAFYFYSPTDNWRWDPSYYYAAIRSPIVEGDFDYRNETIPYNGISQYTAKGLQPSLWPVGPSVLWGAPFLAAHWLMLLFKPAYANGFSSLYIGLVSAVSALMGIIGLMIQYKACCRFGRPQLALLTTALTLFATPLFFYIFRQPLMAHSSSYLFLTLLIWATLLFEQDEIPLKSSGLILGAFTGVYAILRWSGLLIAIIPLGLFGFRIWQAWRTKDHRVMRAILLQIGIFALAIFLCVTPQLATWYQLHGQWLVNPQVGQSIPFTPLHYLNIFFHTNRGLIYWSPFIIVGMVGLLFMPANRLKALFALYVVLYLLPFGFRWDWYGGGGFGPRYLLEILPITSLGFMAMIGRISSRPWARYATLAASLLLVLHQFTLMAAIQNLGRVAWVDPVAYNRGKPLGPNFYITTPLKVLQQPRLLFGYQPNIGDQRQTLYYSLSSGRRSLSLYAIPLIGTIILPVGVLLLSLLDLLPVRKLLPWAAVLLILHQIGWCVYFLSV